MSGHNVQPKLKSRWRFWSDIVGQPKNPETGNQNPESWIPNNTGIRAKNFCFLKVSGNLYTTKAWTVLFSGIILVLILGNEKYVNIVLKCPFYTINNIVLCVWADYKAANKKSASPPVPSTSQSNLGTSSTETSPSLACGSQGVNSSGSEVVPQVPISH